MDRDIDAANATEQLFELYKGDVYRYARFMLGNPTKAEDIVQEVFIKVLRYWDRYRGDASPKTWLFSIVRTCIVDYTRKHKRDQKHFEFTEEYGGHTNLETDPLFEIEEKLRCLSKGQKEVTILRIVHDYSIKETSEILRWSEGKVKTTLHRALKKLRKEEGDHFGTKTDGR